jgi:proline iminopeptidase
MSMVFGWRIEGRQTWVGTLLMFAFLTFVDSAGAQSDLKFAPEKGTIESGKFQLDYFIEGTGGPAIVIGFPNYYSRIFSQNLRSQFRIVFVDHRGSAPSPGSVPLSEFSLDRISDDLELVRNELGLGEVVIIGHSGQALMALEYAKKYPESVSHVVMIGIAPVLGEQTSAEREKYWDKMASADRRATLDANWEGIPENEPPDSYPGQNFIAAYVRNGPRAWYDPDFDSTPLWKGVELNMDMFNHVWGTLFSEIDISQGLNELERPVFLALGRYDFLVAPPSSWNPLKPHFQNLTLQVFEVSGHTPQYEEANLFDSELLNWLGETG